MADQYLVLGSDSTGRGLRVRLTDNGDGTYSVVDVASILAKLSADPATQTTLASILAKIIAAPATEAKQDALIAKDFATQVTLASVLAGIGAVADAAVTDPTASATLVKLLKGLLKQLQGTGSGAAPVLETFASGNPLVTDQDCTQAATNYDIDVNAALGRNGHYGFLKSKSTNTGVVSVAFSSDGVTFSTFIPDIQKGDVMDLDGMDIDTIRVKSTIAGDDVIVEVH